MRRPENLSNYTVEVSSTAWKQLSLLPLGTYLRIREGLETLAAHLRTLTPVPLPKSAVPSLHRSIELEGYVAHYGVDPERKRVTLLEVARRPLSDT